MEQESSRREFAHTKELLGVRTASENCLQSNFLTLYSLKTPAWLTRPLHPRNACISLDIVYTHAMLLFHRSWFTSTQCLFSIGHSLHPSIAYFPGVTFSSQVKAIYYRCLSIWRYSLSTKCFPTYRNISLSFFCVFFVIFL